MYLCKFSDVFHNSPICIDNMSKKLPTYKAQLAYFERLKGKGWIEFKRWIPAELKEQMAQYRDQLLAEYKKTHPEEN